MKLPAGLPHHLHPRLLLFFSADVVGSTALKQADRAAAIPTEARDAKAEDPDRRLEVDWLQIFETFYARIAESTVKHWKALKELCRDEVELNRYVGECPVFWKTNGDEVLYYKVLTDSRQVHFAIEWWKRTIHSVRNSLDQYRGVLEGAGLKPLDLKATAWTAGFPRRNKRIHSAYGLQTSVDGSDKAAQANAKSKGRSRRALQGPKEGTESYYDFIGPGIDIGFRISSLSSTQKMVVSLDVAYILALAQFKVGAGFRREGIYYDGRTSLKGVFAGRRYPIFWINISRDDSFDQEEVKIQQPIIQDYISDICAKYYKRYEVYTHPPFIWNDPSEAISDVPTKFVDWLERANKDHQRQLETQARVSEGVESIADTVDDMGVASRRGLANRVFHELAQKTKISGKAASDTEPKDSGD